MLPIQASTMHVAEISCTYNVSDIPLSTLNTMPISYSYDTPVQVDFLLGYYWTSPDMSCHVTDCRYPETRHAVFSYQVLKMRIKESWDCKHVKPRPSGWASPRCITEEAIKVLHRQNEFNQYLVFSQNCPLKGTSFLEQVCRRRRFTKRLILGLHNYTAVHECSVGRNLPTTVVC